MARPDLVAKAHLELLLMARQTDGRFRVFYKPGQAMVEAMLQLLVAGEADIVLTQKGRVKANEAADEEARILAGLGPVELRNDRNADNRAATVIRHRIRAGRPV